MAKTTDDRSTPQDFFDALDREFHFDIDVCASKENTKCELFITEEMDALSMNSWHRSATYNHTTAWMNPPYSNIMPWVRKAEEECSYGVTTVALLPASVSSKWFHECIWNENTHSPYLGTEIRFPRKRLVFGPYNKGIFDPKTGKMMKTGAKWPSMVVIFMSINSQP